MVGRGISVNGSICRVVHYHMHRWLAPQGVVFMNERIQELADLADKLADDKIQMPGEYHPDWHTVRDQIFAKLIIKECCAITDEVERADLPVVASKFVKAHFGVEE